jgi:hypothetical protein
MAYRKKFIVGDESLNTYGTWLLNAGADMSYIDKFSPAYYDHKDWEVPIGHWENIKLNSKGQWEAEIVIDGADEREKMYIRKIENGDIKGASFGLDILAVSEEPLYLKQGQTRATVTAWQPYEISIVPSPGNASASVLLRNQSKEIRLNNNSKSEIIDKVLPHIQQLKSNKMDKIALVLGLPKDASEDAILNALQPVIEKSKQSTVLSKHIEDLAKAALSESQHQFFTELNKSNPTQALEFLKLHKETEVETEQSAPKVSDVLNTAKAQLAKGKGKESKENEKETYAYLSKHNPEKLLNLKRSEPETFKQMEADYLQAKKESKI